MKTIGKLLGFVQRAVDSAEKVLDATDHVLNAAILYSGEIEADAQHSCDMARKERAKMLEDA